MIRLEIQRGPRGEFALGIPGWGVLPGQTFTSYESEANGLGRLAVTFAVGGAVKFADCAGFEPPPPNDLAAAAGAFHALSPANRKRFATMYADELRALFGGSNLGTMTARALPKPPAGFTPDETNDATEMLREAVGLMLSSDQKSSLRHADRLFRGTRKERAEAQAIVTRVKRQLHAGLNETVRLARERGEDVTGGKTGPVRVRTRDGLLSLLETANITLDEYDRGLEVRQWYEARSAGLGSQLAAQEGKTGHDNDAFARHRLRLAQKSNAVAKLERRIAVDLASDPNALAMFRKVVGEGFSLSSQGKGRAFERNLASLRAALGVALVFDEKHK